MYKDELGKKSFDLDDTEINEFIAKLEKFEKSESKYKLFSNVSFKLAITSIVSLLIAVITNFTVLIFEAKDNYINKEQLLKNIGVAINKDVSLEDLKLIYNKELIKTDDWLNAIINSNSYYKKDSITLSSVLDDIKVSLLTNDNNENENLNKSILNKLNIRISDFNKTNPFEGLTPQDKRDLKNISIKLPPSDYENISDEINSLTLSIKNKDKLINEYLNSSNFSLYISLAAFVFSIAVFVWQSLPANKNSQKKLISEAFKEHLGELKQANK